MRDIKTEKIPTEDVFENVWKIITMGTNYYIVESILQMNLCNVFGESPYTLSTIIICINIFRNKFMFI